MAAAAIAVVASFNVCNKKKGGGDDLGALFSPKFWFLGWHFALGLNLTRHSITGA